MKKYFYEEEGEACYPLESIKDMIASDGLKEREVWIAKRVTGEGWAWCNMNCSPIERGDGNCGGIVCKDYKPRNGISGICKHQGYCYEPIEKVLIKI